jgi:hypothetical protein
MDAMRQALEECDVARACRIWAELYPHMDPPANDAEALVTLHMARTAAESVRFDLRAYSHRWLVDHGHRSLLPDSLRPKAERIYPVDAPGVGIAVRVGSPELIPAGLEIRASMETAVLEAHADGRLTDTPFVRARMTEARAYTRKKLFGR